MSSNDTPPAPSAQSGTVVGESIPTPLLVGMAAGMIYSIIIMICLLSLSKCLLNARVKHIPRARKVKVKKAKKGKKGKKKKKGKKETTSSGTTTSGTKTSASTIM